jgi:anti-anti-sigma factor
MQLSRRDTSCPNCGHLLWCLERTAGDTPVLLLLPDRTPDCPDILQLVQSLEHVSVVPRPVVDLSALDHIRSGLLAQLILLQKQVRGSGGALVLCGLSPLVREVFHRTRIETLFDIRPTLAAAVEWIRPDLGEVDALPAGVCVDCSVDA